MLRFWARNSVLAVAATVFAGAGCEGPAAEVTLVLKPIDEATKEVTKDLRTFRVVLRIADRRQPQVFEFDLEDQGGVFPWDSPNPKLAATVTPGESFTVDVLACPTARTCIPEDVTARGCTGTLVAEAGEPKVVPVEMFAISGPLAPADPPECGLPPDEG